MFNNLFFKNAIESLDSKSDEKNIKDWQGDVIDYRLPTHFFDVLLHCLKSFKIKIVIFILLTIISSISFFIISFICGYVLNHFYEWNANHLIFLFLLFFLAAFFFMIDYTTGILIKYFNIKMLSFLMPSVFQYFLSTPLRDIRKLSVGEWFQIITDYETSLKNIMPAFLLGLIYFLSLILLLCYIATYSVSISMLYFFIYFILMSIKWLMLSKNKTYQIYYLAKQGRMTSFLNESIMQIDKIRSCNVEKEIHKKWLKKIIYTKIGLEKMAKIETIIWLVDAMVPVISLIVFYFSFYMNWLLLKTETLLQLMICISQLSISYEKLSSSMVNFSYFLPGLNRIYLLSNHRTKSVYEAANDFEVQGCIKIENVSLRCTENNVCMLKDISLTIQPSSFVAIVGLSGSGKSTLFKLLLGLESNYSGIISIDNKNIQTLNMSTIRRQFGVVLQNANLFPGTIFSNIVMNANIGLDDAWKIAKLVGIDKDIEAMPMKMYTHLSDNTGESISGGQKQKILIARALAMRPKILFLDEATSALDNNSQALIFDQLKRMNMTRIVIAHRYSTIVDADIIYVMDQGGIIDAGSYKELVARGMLSH